MPHSDFECVYKSLDDPCEVCFKKGLPCGKEEKVWGDKRYKRIHPQSGSEPATQHQPFNSQLPPRSIEIRSGILGKWNLSSDDRRFIQNALQISRFVQQAYPEVQSIISRCSMSTFQDLLCTEGENVWGSSCDKWGTLALCYSLRINRNIFGEGRYGKT
jgi:hypothetical protein